MKIERVLGVMILASLPAPAFAYIDPASGAAITSTIVGVLVAAGLWLKSSWYKVRNFVLRRGPGPKND